MSNQNLIQKEYLRGSLIFMAITGWSFGLMMGVPLFMINTTVPMVVFTSFSLFMWLIFGKKLLNKIYHGVPTK